MWGMEAWIRGAPREETEGRYWDPMDWDPRLKTKKETSKEAAPSPSAS